jgi:DNA-binding transcriptional MocR family regulator
VLFAAEMLSRRPGRVLVEAPTYDRPLKILRQQGADVVPLEMDEEGLDPEALAAELARTAEPPSFLYTIPTFQNPSGRTLSVERRRRLVELAQAHDLPVLEDDPYGLVRFEGASPPTLHELEGGELVTYASSFSKTVAPGLRTGYFVLPEADATAFEDRVVSTYISPPFLVQATIFEFIERGLFEPNLERVRAGLRARRDAMRRALEERFSGASTWSSPEGGYFLWLDLDGHDAGALADRAAPAATVVRGTDFFPRESGLGRSALRLAYSFEPPERIAQGVGALADALPS